jgi:hypothetical protein
MNILIKPNKHGNVIATIAVGKKYYDDWYMYAYPGWSKYCKRHKLGLIVFEEDLIDKSDPLWKKATWQKMLIAETIKNSDLDVRNVCYLDTDILINHMSPNVFNGYNDQTIGLVSETFGLPFSLKKAQRNISFFRHTYYDKKYPLDSAIFMPVDQIYEYHGVDPQPDYACMGFILFNIENHATIMRKWFSKYDRNVKSLTGGGDEPLINYEMQNWGHVSWFDYRFQTLWVFEMAMKYPFLYSMDIDKNSDIVKKCVESSLINSFFLHFAGSWNESNMWKMDNIFQTKEKIFEIEKYYKYMKTTVSGNPVGQIKPQ